MSEDVVAEPYREHDDPFPSIATGGELNEAVLAKAVSGMDNLCEILGREASVSTHYLRGIIFPAFMHFHGEKISASGGDLGGDIVFPLRLGFSGARLGYARGGRASAPTLPWWTL